MTKKTFKLKLTKKQKTMIIMNALKHANEIQTNSMFSSDPNVRARVFAQSFFRYLYGK